MIIKRATTGTWLLICWLVLAAATGTAADQTAADESATSRADLDQLKRESAETIDALKQYSAAQRDVAVDKAEQTLEAMDRRIEQLEARTRQQWGKLTQSAREARETTLQRLRVQRNQAAEWYGGMKHSSAGAWESVKQGFIDSYAVLSDSFRKARDEFGDDDSQTADPLR
jgi:TolA-binding protein